MLGSLADYLRANGVTATIYENYLPAEPDTAVCMYLTPAAPPDPKYPYGQFAFQVRTRAPYQPDAESLIRTIFSLLHGKSEATRNIQVSGYFVVDCLAQQDPYNLGRDDQNRPQFVQNYTLDYGMEIT
jgi:hypothetical protein